MNVVITIGGREAIPVRTLPYMSPSALDPLSPWRIARDLTFPYGDPLGEDWREGERLLHGLRAYYVNDDDYVAEIPPQHWWRLFNGNPDCMEEDEEFGVPYIKSESLSIQQLPPGVFVWRDDFEEAFLGNRSRQWRTRHVCYEPYVCDDMRAIILEGFEPFLRQPAAESAAPVVEPPQASPETDQPDTTGRVAWLVVLLESWPRIVAKHPRPTARQVMAWLKEQRTVRRDSTGPARPLCVALERPHRKPSHGVPQDARDPPFSAAQGRDDSRQVR